MAKNITLSFFYLFFLSFNFFFHSFVVVMGFVPIVGVIVMGFVASSDGGGWRWVASCGLLI